MTKTCTKCKEEKPLEAFPAGKRYENGIRSYCKACAASYSRQSHARRYEANPDAYRRANKKYREAHPGKFKAYQYQYHTAKKYPGMPAEKAVAMVALLKELPKLIEQSYIGEPELEMDSGMAMRLISKYGYAVYTYRNILDGKAEYD